MSIFFRIFAAHCLSWRAPKTMARQLGVIQYRGKLGQTVGMKNGYGGSESFSREYISTNSSQSDAQINRRLRLLPAVNFRRQLDQVISRGWQGENYGGPTNRKFMQNALRLPLSSIPQLEKGDSRAIPGEYQISKGSIPQVEINAIGDDESLESTIYTNLSPLSPSTTVKALTEDLLSANTWLRDGDQITFIRVSTPNTDIPYCVYEVFSFQLQADNTDTLANAFPGVDITDIDGALGLDGVALAGAKCCAGAVVVSREGTTPKRSTSYMTVDKSLLAEFFSSSVKANVRQSYMKSTASTLNTNWAYDPDSATEDTSFVTIAITIEPTGGGTVTGAGTYAKGDSVTLQATAATGYSFSRWNLNGAEIATTRTLQITAASNATYEAEFIPEE